MLGAGLGQTNASLVDNLDPVQRAQTRPMIPISDQLGALGHGQGNRRREQYKCAGYP